MVWLVVFSMLFLGGGCVQQEIATKDVGNSTFFYQQMDMDEVVSYFVASLHKADICQGKKLYRFDKMHNETYEHIDTKAFVKQFVSMLEESGKCHFLGAEEESADAVFYGNISAIYQKNMVEKDMYYIFRLYLIDTKTGVLLWSDTKEIRKRASRALIGW